MVDAYVFFEVISEKATRSLFEIFEGNAKELTSPRWTTVETLRRSTLSRLEGDLRERYRAHWTVHFWTWIEELKSQSIQYCFACGTDHDRSDDDSGIMSSCSFQWSSRIWEIKNSTTRPSGTIEMEMKTLFDSPSNKLDSRTHHFVAPNEDDSNVCLIPKVAFKANRDIDRQKATWRNAIHKA